MHNSTLTLKPLTPSSTNRLSSSSSSPFFLQNPKSTLLSHNYKFKKPQSPINYCNANGIQLSVASHRSKDSNGAAGGGLTNTAVVKKYDVATLGNLCVDVILNVPTLPPSAKQERKAYMDQLAQSPPDKRYWEAGGNCNMAIAAARLGLQCIAIGHVGDEIYGRFLLDVLHDEGVGVVGMNEEKDVVQSSNGAYETLLCWVLVDPLQRHGFCSRADFSEEPAFSWMQKLSFDVKMAIKQSKVLFCNGYGFDELPTTLIVSAMEYAVEVGTSIFFDPGPRGKSLSTGTSQEQEAFDKCLRMTDVLLLTSDEAESLTGLDNPILAGQKLLRKGVRTKWVIVKVGAKGSLVITKSNISCAPSFKVNVIDTVGCGDSYVAAIAYGYIYDMGLVYTLTLANAVGAATAMGCGAGRNVANLNQVIQLLRGSNINEDDDKFWTDLFEQNIDTDAAEEITFLSEMIVNGSRNKNWGAINSVALQDVVSQVLPKLLQTSRVEEGVAN